MTRVVEILIALGLVAAVVLQGLRWLRVLQREHYEPGSVSRFAWRWSTVSFVTSRRRTISAAPLTASVIVVVATLFVLRRDVGAACVALVAGWYLPLGLSVRGRTSKLSWTRRLRTVALVASLVTGALALVALVFPRPWIVGVVVVALVPFIVDAAATLTRPFENRLAQKFVDRARTRLHDVDPTVVAITGSYGKTSTKHHLAELLGGHRGVVPSPRSYNNRAGLSRAINENLADGTSIFIAEMGTYGPGEIADLTAWCPPDISVVTAIGPVHLERMKSLDVIEAAKFEITEAAPVVVLNIDDERLVGWVERLRASGKTVLTAGSDNTAADVRVVTVAERWQVLVHGTVVAICPPVVGVRESNLACAIATCVHLGLTIDEIVGRFTHLTSVPNRMVVVTAPSGVMVIDDTFNANPAGARAALAALRDLPLHGRRVVVTPGMVELGTEQNRLNHQLAVDIQSMGATMVVVSRTNARALLAGSGTTAMYFAHREQAVEWVRASLVAGDGVLYLNDLPDHYP